MSIVHFSNEVEIIFSIEGRIRGLVNFRTEPIYSPSALKTKPLSSRERQQNEETQQKITSEGDQTAQLDIEHMGLMS